MDKNQAIFLGAIGILAVGIAYYAMSQTDTPVPETQNELQVMGLGVENHLKLGSGTPLDMRPEIHFWNPGDYGEDIGVVTTPHRYPSIPGGNVTAVMHQGWACLTQKAPTVNDWFLNPPEVAII